MKLKQIADINFPTRWANFRLKAFEALSTGDAASSGDRQTALALVLGDVRSFPPMVRIHSQCMTGEVFHSLRCDCHDQLQLALRAIAREGAGVLVYERQEGRGIGLMEKLRAYELQDQGLDTVDANLRLGHAVDLRDYAMAVEILHLLEIRAVRLISNNPEKIRAVVSAGIQVVERVSADVPRNPHSIRYLSTKRERLGHLSSSAVDAFELDDFSGDGRQRSEASADAICPDGEAGAGIGGGSWQMS